MQIPIHLHFGICNCRQMCFSQPYHNTGASDSGTTDVGPTQQEDAIAKNPALSITPCAEAQLTSKSGKMDKLKLFLSFYKSLVVFTFTEGTVYRPYILTVE